MPSLFTHAFWHHFMQIDGETVRDFILGAPKSLQMVTEAIKLKRCLLLGRKAMTNLDSILKRGDITLV